MGLGEDSTIDRYLTLATPCEGLFKAKGSKHFGYVFPIDSEADVEGHLAALRKQHHAARHHCYAWRLGPEGERYRANDDGEPNNSAGPPILGALRSRDLTNCLAVVVRYFGGTKLGVGGMIEAYREATLAALDEGEIVERFVLKTFKISFPYVRMGVVMGHLKKWDVAPAATDFDISCSLEASIRLRDAEAFAAGIEDVDVLVQALRTK